MIACWDDPANRKNRAACARFALLHIGLILVCTEPALGQSSSKPSREGRSSYTDWTGFYVGAHVGYSRGKARSLLADPPAAPDPADVTSEPATPIPISFDSKFGSLMGGVQAGYNYTLPSRLLLGLEADITFPNFLGADDVIASRVTQQADTAHKLDSISTLRGRVGYAFNRLLVYGTGGFAWSQVRFLQTPAVVEDRDHDKVLGLAKGWTLGAGIEVPIARTWNAKIEYLYAHFGNVTGVFPSGTRYESEFDIQMFRLGLNRPLFQLDMPATGRSTSKTWVGISENNWNIHGQLTAVGQGYRHFHSPYQGENSLSGADQFKNTGSATAYIGLRAWEGGEIYVNPELMQGFGLSDVHGVAAFPNGEAQKSSFPIPRLNIARAFVRQTFGLGGEQETIEDGPNQLGGKQDISRITVSVGKFAVPDFLYGNSYANDPRTTFLNWNMYGGGSYDWVMDKLSWTWGAVFEFNQKHWTFRTGYFLVPVESNSNMFDMHVLQRGQYTAELELRYSLFSQPGKVRLFGWLQRAYSGGYTDALALPIDSPDYPDITLTRRTRTNYGFVTSLEQPLTDNLGVFTRASWSPGLVEVMGWTDCSASISFGTVLKGSPWGRPNDRIGGAVLLEALSPIARAYFAAGGLGILIGDGALNYRQEKVLEAYYAFGVNKWSAITFDYQYIVNPG